MMGNLATDLWACYMAECDFVSRMVLYAAWKAEADREVAMMEKRANGEAAAIKAATELEDGDAD